MVDSSLTLRMNGYSLTTAEILYRLPDHPGILQTYVWQEFDTAPRFPRLQGFLAYWSENLEGALYMVRVAHKRLVTPQEFCFADGQFHLH